MAATIENSEYNLDELHAPSWLNKDFFEMVLKQYENNEIVQVENYEIRPGTAKGDHYASVIFRAKISYTTRIANAVHQECTSWIIKTAPHQEGMKKDLLQNFTFFKTEILMYTEILPCFNHLLKSHGDCSQLYPRMIYSSTNPHECIIFEDLGERGYTAVSKRDLTMCEVNLSLEKLARLHAASYKMCQEDNKIPTTMNRPVTKDGFTKFQFLQEGASYLKNLLSSQDDLQMYVQYIENIEKSLVDEVIEYFDPEKIKKRGSILVLTHGDFHSRNIMVQYKDHTLNDVMLIDFQLCFYGSVVLDLMYASVLLLSPEMRMSMKHRDEIFSNYIRVFQTTLEQLNFSGKIPTKTDFENEWKRYKRWELFLVMNYLIFTYAGKIPLSDIVEKPEVRRNIWHDKKFIDEYRAHMSRMCTKGILE